MPEKTDYSKSEVVVFGMKGRPTVISSSTGACVRVDRIVARRSVLAGARVALVDVVRAGCSVVAGCARAGVRVDAVVARRSVRAGVR